jgi:hypothetical protein
MRAYVCRSCNAVGWYLLCKLFDNSHNEMASTRYNGSVVDHVDKFDFLRNRYTDLAVDYADRLKLHHNRRNYVDLGRVCMCQLPIVGLNWGVTCRCNVVQLPVTRPYCYMKSIEGE